MEKEYHPLQGFPLNLNSGGGLEEGSYWDGGIAEGLARMNGIGPLTPDHWKVINFVRQYYLEQGTAPATYKIHRATGFRLQRLFELFPGAIAWNTHFIAGLPHPGDVVQKKESGLHSEIDAASASFEILNVPAPSLEGTAPASIPAPPDSKRNDVRELIEQNHSFARLLPVRKIALAAVLVVAFMTVGVFLKNPVQRKNIATLEVIPMTKVAAQIQKGLIEIPLNLVKENGLVSFEYKGKYGELPLLAYITPSKKIVTLVGISKPCSSKSFHLEGKEIVCNVCFTRWDLDSLKGISGECLANSPEIIPHLVHEGRIIVTEMDIRKSMASS